MKLLKAQLEVVKRYDPSFKNKLSILLYPSFKALFYHKISNFFYRHKLYFLAQLICNKAKRKTGIEIHPGAVVNDDVFIDHGAGVVIGETAVVGHNTLIYHGVTLGAIRYKIGKRHPTIGDNVIIGAGAKVMGDIKIGNNVKIGVGAVLVKDLPDNVTYVGVPKMKIIKHRK